MHTKLRRVPGGAAPADGTSLPSLDIHVMQMVREQLKREPPPPLAALYGRAVRINPEIRKLSLQQFNARYPLQVRRRLKREQGAAGPSARDGRKRPAPRQDELRTRIRTVLLQYAKAMLAAKTAAEVIDVVEGVDPYVDAIVKGTGDRDDR